MVYKFPKYPTGWPIIIKRVKKRDNFTCQDCKTKHPPWSKYLDVHHKVPLSKGGKSIDKNLVTLCYRCHSKYHLHLRKFLEKNKNKSKITRSKANKRKQPKFRKIKFGYF